MTLRDSFETAVRALTANKLRSALTMLGVVIGVGSVIAMIGIGEGTKRKSLENIEIMGSNMLMIFPNWRRGGMSMGGDNMSLKDEDVQDIKRYVETVDLITGGVNGGVTAKYGSNVSRTRAVGAEPQYAIIRNSTKMHAGKWFTHEDDAEAERVAVLGYQVYEDLFGSDNPIGATLKLNGQNFEVIGVINYKGGSGMMNQDDQVFVPLKTARTRLLGKTNLDFINLNTKSSEFLPYTQMKVEEVLGRKRRSAAGDQLFRVMNQGEWIEQIEAQSRLLSLLLAGIASVSLLVGGIGIMNIMLVSVTERTREIGLRKAIGAKRETVLSQFLLESIVLCTLGGVVGIILGSVGVKYVAEAMQVPPAADSRAILLAFGFSAMVGLFFGFYPALRASRLQPIEALRYE
ncbi:MAG: ABC transporter permease [Fimbriimonadaceae bacterium]